MEILILVFFNWLHKAEINKVRVVNLCWPSITKRLGNDDRDRHQGQDERGTYQELR